MEPRVYTRADFDAWLATQPQAHRVPGADHARWIRWCASVLAAGGRIADEELPSAAPAPASPPDPPPVAVELPPVDLDAPFAGMDPDGPLVAYTDGSGNTADRPCGAGVVIFDGAVAFLEASRYLGHGTNNHAELSALRIALAITDAPGLRERELLIRSDSEYAIGCATRAADPYPGAANAKLISLVRKAMRGRRVRIEWVKGHAGDPGNERADELAGLARKRGIAAETRAA